MNFSVGLVFSSAVQPALGGGCLSLVWFCPDGTRHALLVTGFLLTGAIINSAGLIHQRKPCTLKKAKGAKCSSGVVQFQAESGQISTGGASGSVRSVEIPGMGSCCAVSALVTGDTADRCEQCLSPSPGLCVLTDCQFHFVGCYADSKRRRMGTAGPGPIIRSK